jgi:prolyl oligopeptidase
MVIHRLYQQMASSEGGAHRFFTSSTTTTPKSKTKPDAFEYLENVSSDESMSWVREQNAKTLERLSGPEKDERYARILAALDSKEKIPYVQKRGPNRFYNFWKDEAHPKGLWRRLSNLADLKDKDFKGWETVLDLDALDVAEGKPGWVWKGCVCVCVCEELRGAGRD